MKMTKILSFVLVLIMIASCFAACGGDKTTESTKPTPQVNPLAGTYDIKVWVSELAGVVELTQEQIDRFEAANPGIIINAEISGVGEGDAATQVLNDVASAPDIFCFAQDQLARLVQSSALAAIPDTIVADIRNDNDAGSVLAGSVAGKLYAYPMTSDNGYYMYYDTSIITNPDSLEQIIADVEAYNEKNGTEKWIRYPLENAWYTASFFFATGCHSEWTTDDGGNFTGIDDDFNSEKGLIAMKGMQALTHSPAYNSDNTVYTDAAVWITGTWDSGKARDHFGENLGATDLPSFTVDGKEYHLGSFTGNKLMGVKPQADSNRGLVLALLAQFLTNEQCQLDRFLSQGWGPSNLKAQQNEAVQADPSLAALALQGAYGRPQGQIHGGWWDIAKVLGADAKAAKTEAELQKALDTYRASIDALFQMTDEQKMAWSVIGSMQSSEWKTDFPMTQVSDGVWESVEIQFSVGDIYKLRRGAAWDVQVGADGQMKTPEIEPGNISSDVAGTYKVRLEWDGTSTTATVTLIPVE